MYSGFMDTPQNKNPPFPLAVIPTGSPFPVPKVCSFICGGRRPATGPQTSSGIWEDRRMGTVRDQEGGAREATLRAQVLPLGPPPGAASSGAPRRPPCERTKGEAQRSLVREAACWVSAGLGLLDVTTVSTVGGPGYVPLDLSLSPRGLEGPQQSWARPPLPDDVLQGCQQRLHLVLDAVLGTQGLHQWGDLV